MPDTNPRRRRSLRLRGYDYSQAGAYFITVCTHLRVALFGEVVENDVRLNQAGMMVKDSWGNLIAYYGDIDLDAFVVMPNHVHGIIVLADGGGTRRGIPEIVRGFKTFSARGVNELRQTRGALWQRGYYEHVIRNETALNRIRGYIANNPARWADDPDNIPRPGFAAPGRV
jgi:REP element-mobilizing transposase RayT